MRKEIITFREWYEREPLFGSIFTDCPVLNFLYPDSALTWMASLSPALTPADCVFEEAWHRFSERFVYVPYLVGLDNSGQIHRIQKDITYQAVSEWNHWVAFKELINAKMNESMLFKLLGNYSLTKEGGWTDNYIGEAYTDKTTYARETGSAFNIKNFEGTEIKSVSTTDLSTIPTADDTEPSLEHNHVIDSGGYNEHTFDGGSSADRDNYIEYGQRMGHLWEYYKDLLNKFPSAVDTFLKVTATAYLTDVYDTNMWYHTLYD